MNSRLTFTLALGLATTLFLSACTTEVAVPTSSSAIRTSTKTTEVTTTGPSPGLFGAGFTLDGKAFEVGCGPLKEDVALGDKLATIAVDWSPSGPIEVHEIAGVDPDQFVAVEMNANDLCADGADFVLIYYLADRGEDRTEPYPCDLVDARCEP